MKPLTQSKKRIIKLSLSVVMLIISVFFIYHNAEKFEQLLSFSISSLVVISIIDIISLGLYGYLFKIVVEMYNIKLNFHEWFGLTCINRQVNLLLLKTGPLVRGVYLKRVHGLSFTKFSATLIMIMLLQIFMASLVALISIGIVFIMHDFINIYLFLFFFVLTTGSLLALLSPRSILRLFKTRLTDKLSQVLSSVSLNKIIIFKIIFTLLIIIIIYALRLSIIYKDIEMSLSPVTIMVIASSGILASLLTLTPGALGIKEALMAYTAKLSGANFVDTVAATSLDRILITFWVILLGLSYSYWYTNRLSKSKQKT